MVSEPGQGFGLSSEGLVWLLPCGPWSPLRRRQSDFDLCGLFDRKHLSQRGVHRVVVHQHYERSSWHRTCLAQTCHLMPWPKDQGYWRSKHNGAALLGDEDQRNDRVPQPHGPRRRDAEACPWARFCLGLLAKPGLWVKQHSRSLQTRPPC